MAEVVIRNLPVKFDRAVKRRVEQDAEQNGRSLNDVVVGHVAKHFGVAFDGTGRRSPGTSGSIAMNLRLPEPIYDSVRSRSFSDDQSKNEVIERILCTVYGLEYVPRKSGPKASAAA